MRAQKTMEEILARTRLSISRRLCCLCIFFLPITFPCQHCLKVLTPDLNHSQVLAVLCTTFLTQLLDFICVFFQFTIYVPIKQLVLIFKLLSYILLIILLLFSAYLYAFLSVIYSCHFLGFFSFSNYSMLSLFVP